MNGIVRPLKQEAFAIFDQLNAFVVVFGVQIEAIVTRVAALDSGFPL